MIKLLAIRIVASKKSGLSSKMEALRKKISSELFIFSICDALNPKKAASLAEIRPEHINKMIIANKPKLTLRDILAITALKIKSFPKRDRTTDKISKHDSVYSRFKIYIRAFNSAKLSKIRSFPLKNSLLS